MAIEHKLMTNKELQILKLKRNIFKHFNSKKYNKTKTLKKHIDKTTEINKNLEL